MKIFENCFVFVDLCVTCSVRLVVKEWFKFLTNIAARLLFVTKSAMVNVSLFADPTINYTAMNVRWRETIAGNLKLFYNYSEPRLIHFNRISKHSRKKFLRNAHPENRFFDSNKFVHCYTLKEKFIWFKGESPCKRLKISHILKMILKVIK